MSNELNNEIEKLRKKQKNKNLATRLLLTGIETVVISNGVNKIKDAIDEHEHIKFVCENDDKLIDPRFKVIGHEDPKVALEKSKRKTFVKVCGTLASTILMTLGLCGVDYVCKDVIKMSTNKEIGAKIASSKKKEQNK